MTSHSNATPVEAPTSPYEGDALPIPDYLEKHYWWAYVRPWAVRVFEREWLVNLILWGCYRLLRDKALQAWSEDLSGRTLQISCCYGSLTPQLAQRIQAAGGSLDVLDVSPAQLHNLRRKIPSEKEARIFLRDATNLSGFADNAYDRVLLFFLPHEQPRDVRLKTFTEAMRVLKPGGELMIVEFHKPHWWHPLRYVWLPVLTVLEPFAPDLWKQEIQTLLPLAAQNWPLEKTTYFGRFYQRVRLKKPA